MTDGNDIAIKNNQQVDIGGHLIGGDYIQITVYQQFIPEPAITHYADTATASDSLQAEKQKNIAPNPYKGLAAFQEKDANHFFGREALSQKLWQKFNQLQDINLQESNWRILPILGPSGSGKSSLARAGLLPQIANHPLPGVDKMRVEVFTPGVRPLESLARVLARVATGDPSPAQKTLEFAQLMQKKDSLPTIIATLPDAEQTSLVLLIDQFEEVYTLCENNKDRNLFIQHLQQTARDKSQQLSIILTLRSDFLGETQQHGELNQHIAQHGMIIPAMSEQELFQAISQPAIQANYPFDSAVIALLIEQSNGREGVLPLLQFALTQIWDALPQDPAKTLEKIGGVGGALAQKAEAIYSQLAENQKAIARRAFLKMIQLGEGSRDTRRRAVLSEMIPHRESMDEVREVLNRFSGKDSRLISLSIEKTDNNPGVSLAHQADKHLAEVTHEALLENWEELNQWLDNARDDLRFERRLNENIEEWEKQKQPIGLLWSTPEHLNSFKAYYQNYHDEMTDPQIHFYQASQKEYKRKRNQKRFAIWTIVVLLLGIAFGGFFYAKEQKRLTELAQKQQKEALESQSLFLTELAKKYNKQNKYVTAMRLALAALPHKNNQFPNRPFIIQAQEQLHVAYAKLKYGVVAHDGSVRGATFSPDGTQLLTYSGNHAYLWESKNGLYITTLSGHKSSVWSATFSPDGKTIVTASADNTARIWNSKNGQSIAVLTGHKSSVASGSFSPDGKTIITRSGSNARLWNSKNGQSIAILKGHSKKLNYASFSPDGKTIITASHDNTARLWDGKNGQSIAVLTGHKSSVFSATFCTDGKTIITASADNTARIWDSKKGQSITLLKGHTYAVMEAVFSPDCKTVVTASEDGTAQLWDSKTGQSVALKGHKYRINSAAFSPDGKKIVTASEDSTARLWDSKTGQSIAVFLGHEKRLHSASFSPDGKTIVTASYDSTAQLWPTFTDTKDLIAQVHSGLRRKTLTCAERKHFFLSCNTDNKKN